MPGPTYQITTNSPDNMQLEWSKLESVINSHKSASCKQAEELKQTRESFGAAILAVIYQTVATLFSSALLAKFMTIGSGRWKLHFSRRVHYWGFPTTSHLDHLKVFKRILPFVINSLPDGFSFSVDCLPISWDGDCLKNPASQFSWVSLECDAGCLSCDMSACNTPISLSLWKC